MSRDLTEVIDQMLGIIPASEESLIAVLSDHKSSAQFAAPEAQAMWWKEVAVTLSDRFKRRSALDEWEHEIISVWMGLHK